MENPDYDAQIWHVNRPVPTTIGPPPLSPQRRDPPHSTLPCPQAVLTHVGNPLRADGSVRDRLARLIAVSEARAMAVRQARPLSQPLRVLVIAGLAAAACSGISGGALQSPRYADAVGAGVCAPLAPRCRPLTADWRPDTRGDLEIAMKQGIAVVAYDHERIEVLDGCQTEGEYGFLGMTRRDQIVSLETAGEVRANLPSLLGHQMPGQMPGQSPGRAKLAGALERGTSLDIALVMIGKRVTTRRRVSRDQLRGHCAGATHFVRGATVGAFAMQTRTQAHSQSVADLFGAQIRGSGTAGRRIHTREGDLEDCAQATPEATSPPSQCGAPLRLDLVRLEGSVRRRVPASLAEPPPVPDPVVSQPPGLADTVCPGGLVLRDGKCAHPAADAPHQCRGADRDDCPIQCAQGHAGSCANLGWMYENGEGVKRDLTQAMALYRTACRGGDAVGCRGVGWLYENGLGVSVDLKRAAELYSQACRDGDPLGCSNLGVMYRKGRGVPQDGHKAATLYRRACDGGNPRGCINLGFLYEKGMGVRRDRSAAARLYERGCDGEKADGCINLAWMADEGVGVPQDKTRALTLFERACELGDDEICIEAGARYDNGVGVPEDSRRAATLFRFACQQRVAKGCSNLGILYRYGRGAPQDSQHAARAFGWGCEGGDPNGCAGLGLMYIDGEEVPHNPERGIGLIEKACADGSSWACQARDKLR